MKMVKNEVKVFARLKPEENRRKVVNYQIHKRPKKHRKEDFLVLNAPMRLLNDYINNRPESWNYSFCNIFDEDSRQEEIFENVAQPVIQSVLNGYNGTIFAYGQTGSGKTHSITGDLIKYDGRGILPRTVQYLFDVIRKNPNNLYSIEIAYLEIYNENGYDLLDPKHGVTARLEDLPRVTIQEDEAGVLHLKNLSFHNVDNEKNALDLLFIGDTNRAISETPMNAKSSRSHCIFTIVVSVKLFGENHHSRAKMHLVDLAGSERVYKCAITGTILREAKHINLSLHYLEQVIVCLGQESMIHIPYRNSLLTAILRDSLGGNCLTTMLATISIAATNLEETISTCRFAQRVALVRNDVNLVFGKNQENENMFLKMEVEKLKKRILQLTNQHPTEDLTEDEKHYLDSQEEEFLKSNSSVDWDKDPKKSQYCTQLLRKNSEATAAVESCTGHCAKTLEYYKNMVSQRDEEISLLINMLKKEKKTGTKSTSNVQAILENSEDLRENSPSRFVRDKKHCLKQIADKAKPIAECVRNGKLAIAKLRKRLRKTDPKNTEVHELHQTLEFERTKLAENLTILRSLKSEASSLKVALSKEESNFNSNNNPTITENVDSHPNISKINHLLTTNSKTRSNNSVLPYNNDDVDKIRKNLVSPKDSENCNVLSLEKHGKEEITSNYKEYVKMKNIDLEVPPLDVVEEDISEDEVLVNETEYDISFIKENEDKETTTNTAQIINEDSVANSHENCSTKKTQESLNEPAITTPKVPGFHITQKIVKRKISNKNDVLDKSSPITVETEPQQPSKLSPEIANSDVHVGNQKCSFRTPTILRNILCFDRDSSKKDSALKRRVDSTDNYKTTTKIVKNDFNNHGISNNGDTELALPSEAVNPELISKYFQKKSLTSFAEQASDSQDNLKPVINDFSRTGGQSKVVAETASLHDSCLSEIENPKVILENFQNTTFNNQAGLSSKTQDNVRMDITDFWRTGGLSEEMVNTSLLQSEIKNPDLILKNFQKTSFSSLAGKSSMIQDNSNSELIDFARTGSLCENVMETSLLYDHHQNEITKPEVILENFQETCIAGNSKFQDNPKPKITDFSRTGGLSKDVVNTMLLQDSPQSIPKNPDFILKDSQKTSFSNLAGQTSVLQDNLKLEFTDFTRTKNSSKDVVNTMLLQESCQSETKNPDLISKNFQKTSFSSLAGHSSKFQDNLKLEMIDSSKKGKLSENVESTILTRGGYENEMKNPNFIPKNFQKESFGSHAEQSLELQDNLKPELPDFTRTENLSKDIVNTMLLQDSPQSIPKNPDLILKDSQKTSFSNLAGQSSVLQDNLKLEFTDFTRTKNSSKDVVNTMLLQESCRSETKNPDLILKNFQKTSFSSLAGHSSKLQDNLKLEMIDSKKGKLSENVESTILTRGSYENEMKNPNSFPKNFQKESFGSHAEQSLELQDNLKPELPDFTRTENSSKDIVNTLLLQDSCQSETRNPELMLQYFQKISSSNHVGQSSGFRDNIKPELTDFARTGSLSQVANSTTLVQDSNQNEIKNPVALLKNFQRKSFINHAGQSSGFLHNDRPEVPDCTRTDEKIFINSLPLTGNPEIDEEIIAFYKAKRSGGAY